MNTLEKRENSIVFMTKCILLVMGLLTAIPLVNHVARDMYKLCCVWCFLLIVYFMVKRRKNYWKIEYVLLFLFCGFYLLTIILGTRQHLINEIAILGYTGILFFSMTYCDRKQTQEQVKRELTIMAWIFVGITFLFSLAGLLMFLFSYSGELLYDGGSYIYGMWENRLWGLYNPNTGSTINYISIILSVLIFKKNLWKKIFLAINIIIQTLCFILTQSRGGWVCIIVYLFLYWMFVKEYKYQIKKVWKQWCYKIVIWGVICVLVVTGSSVMKKGLSNIPVMIEKMQIVGENKVTEIEESLQESISNGSSEVQQEEVRPSEQVSATELQDYISEEGTNLERVDKKERNLESISTGRTGIWKIGFEAYKTHPILGIGYRSVDDVLKEKMTEWGYENSSGGGLHSIYVTVLVSSGAVGFLLFAFYIVIILKKVVKCVFIKKMPQYVKAISILIPVILVGELVESRIVLGINFLAILFWIIVGYVSFYAEEGEKNGKCNCTGF